MIRNFDANNGGDDDEGAFDGALEVLSSEICMQEVVDLFAANEMRKYPPELYSDSFERNILEEECTAKWRKQLIQRAVQTISSSPGPHPHHIWEAAAEWDVEAVQRPPTSLGDGGVSYLERFGYTPLSPETWKEAPGTTGGTAPELLFRIPHPYHEEHVGHTWYLIECSLVPRIGQSRQITVKCLAPRRLAHIREIIQVALMAELEGEYSSKFAGAPFPLRMAPHGTTGRLQGWLNELANQINVGTISPALVAWVLNFCLPLRLGQLSRNSVSNDTRALSVALTQAAQRPQAAPEFVAAVSPHLTEPDAARRMPEQNMTTVEVLLPNASDVLEEGHVAAPFFVR